MFTKVLLALLLVPVLGQAACAADTALPYKSTYGSPYRGTNTAAKQQNKRPLLWEVAPVYPIEIWTAPYGNVRFIAFDGTPMAMNIYTTEDHLADWIEARLGQPMWLTLDPVLLPYPNGLAWRLHTVAVYDLDTGQWIESVTTRIKPE